MLLDDIQLPQIRQEFFVPDGGLDLTTPPLQLPPGAARAVLNFEQDISSGYARIAGYDLVNFGDVTPAEMDLRVAVVTTVPTYGFVYANDILTGGTSRATMVFVNDYVVDPLVEGFVNSASFNQPIYVCAVRGTFINGERIFKNGNDIGFINTAPVALTGTTAADLRLAQFDAEQAARRAIPKVGATPYATTVGYDPVGQILGVVRFRGQNYAWRRLPLSQGEFAECYVCSPQGGVTGRLPNVWQSASFFDGLTIANRHAVAGAHFEFVEYNFTGGLAQRRLFGVSGAGRAFEFDGSTWTFISTGATVDTPKHIAVHQNRLFLSTGSTLAFSDSIDHTDFVNPGGNANFFEVGDEITNLKVMRSTETTMTLLVTTVAQQLVLYGEGTTDVPFALKPYNVEDGAEHHTAQVIGQPIYSTDYGLSSLLATQDFGSFAVSDLTNKVKPYVAARRRKAVASTIVRAKNQYRIYYNDRTALYVTMKGHKVKGVMPVELRHQITCLHSSIDATTGAEWILAGTSTGEVIKMETGDSFAGRAIAFHLGMAFHQFKSPRLRKHFMRLVLEIKGSGYTEFDIGADLDYANLLVSTQEEELFEAPAYGTGPFWDDDSGEWYWDTARWDGASEVPIPIKMEGDGENFALRLRGSSAIVAPFRVSGAIVHYTTRRQSR